MSPIRALRELIFEYEDARRIRMARDAYAREQGYNQAKAEDQEQLDAKEEQIQQNQEQIQQDQEQIRQEQERSRQLEEEIRRLRNR
jgi:peptidoglycan hydrolase CwlO-like protein